LLNLQLLELKIVQLFLRGDNTFAAAGLDGWSSSSGNLLSADAAKGIYLGVASATAANLLDDYEEGDWSPIISGTGGAPSGVSYGERFGSYVKIGNCVTVQVYVNLDSWSSGPSGSLTITTLPFTSSSTSAFRSSVVIGFTQILQ